MASPAAILSVLVKAEGIARTNAQLQGLHGDLGKSSKAAGKLGTDLDKSTRTGTKALAGLKSAAGLAGLAVGAAGLAGAVKDSIGEYREAQKVGAQTNAVIKSTGGAAGISAKHVGDLATAISKKAGIDDEAIQSGENLLLTFKGIRNETGKGNDVFNQATQVITDMSVSLKQGLKPSAIQVGKALNDPVKGITALGRVGVQFTEGQKKMIAGLVKSGDTLGAQKIILKELKSEFGGSAAAAATAGDHLQVSFKNLEEALGSVLVPAIDKVATVLATLFDQMVQNKGIGGAMVSTFKTLGGTIGAVVGVIKDIVEAFKQSHAWAVVLVATVGALTAGFIAYKAIVTVTTAVTKAWAAAQALLNIAMDANPVVLVVAAIAALAAGLVIAYEKSETFRKIVDSLFGVIKTVTGAVWGFVTSLKDLPGKIYAAGKALTDGLISGIKAVPDLLAKAATWLWSKLKDGIESYIDAYKSAGSWVLNRIVDGFKVITELLKTVGGWVKNRIVEFIHAEVAGLNAVGTWVLNRIVDGFRIVTGLLATVGKWVKNRIGDFIRLEIDGLTSIGSWIVNRVVEGFKTVTKALGTVGGWFKNRIVDFIQLEAKGFKEVGSTIIGWIVDGFKSGVNLLVDLVNDIIDVINVIPGIPNIKHVKHVGGGGGGGGGGGDPTPHKRAKGGMVPGSGYGDKVPLHIAGKLAAMVEPGELVSVANRNATAALMGVNSAIPRFTTGGILNTQEMSDLWRSKGGNSSIADTMGVIGLVESGGKPWAHNPSGASGLWQILGQLVPGNIFNPGVNALNAIAKYKSQGLSAWDASRSKWEPLIGKKVGPDPLDLIGKLPGVGNLPDWLKGTGKYVLDKVGAWIKDNVVKAVTGGGGPIESGPNGVGTFEGVPMANWVIGSLKYGRRHGAFGNPTSGYRPGFDPHTLTGASEHQGTRYPHGAVDFGGYHDARALAEKLSYVHATAGYKYPLLAPKGFVDDGHASGTGHMRGGVLPFLGSYHTGGIAPREGIAHVAAGERMTPAGRGGPLVNIEHAEFKQGIDINSFAARIGFKIATA